MSEYWGNVYFPYFRAGQKILWFGSESSAQRDSQRPLYWYGDLRPLPAYRVHVKMKQTQ